MRVFLTLYTRKWSIYCLLCLLLAFAVAVCCIGFSASGAAAAQLAAVDSQHTTIALAPGYDQELLYQRLYDQHLTVMNMTADGSLVWTDGSTTYSAAYLYEQAQQAPQLRQRVTGGLLAARLTNGQSIASGTLQPTEYKQQLDMFPHALCVLAVRCDEVADISQVIGESPVGLYYQMSGEILAAPSLQASGMELVGGPVRMSSSLMNEDGTCPFEVGKTYLLRGLIGNWTMCRHTADDGSVFWEPLVSSQSASLYLFDQSLYSPAPQFVTAPQLEAFAYKEITVPESITLPNMAQPTGDAVEYEYGVRYSVATNPDLPFWTEYTGDWQAFLETAEGAVWRDEIIPWTQLNQNSVQVALTEDITTTYNFNTGMADILEGRQISAEEYAAGADVCLVSAYLAQANGWQVGDTVELDLYSSLFCKAPTTEAYAEGDTLKMAMDYIWQRLPLFEADALGLQKQYTIVGIYTAPAYATGIHNFTAETVFVPKASVPNAEAYDNPNVDFCNALLLENGTQEEFEAYMAEQGFEDAFVYFDQDFAQLKEAYTALAANARRLCVLGCGILLLALAAGFFIQHKLLAPVALGLRRMGTQAGAVVRAGLPAQLLLALAASALGGGAAAVLYTTVTEKLLGQAMELSAAGLLAGAAVGFVLQLPVALLCLYSAAKSDPMKNI